MLKRTTILTLMLLALLVPAAANLHAAEPADKELARHDTTAAHDVAGTTSAHENAVHESDEHGSRELVPGKLDASEFWQVIWTVIIFILLVVILYPTAWKSVLAGLKAREDRIRKDISDAEAARLKAEASLKDYTAQLATAEGKVRDLLAKATTDAEAISQNIRMRAQQEAEEAKEKAQRDIEAARDQALAQLHEESVNLATNIAEKIIRRNLNPDDQRDLLARSLDELQTVGSR